MDRQKLYVTKSSNSLNQETKEEKRNTTVQHQTEMKEPVWLERSKEGFRLV